MIARKVRRKTGRSDPGSARGRSGGSSVSSASGLRLVTAATGTARGTRARLTRYSRIRNASWLVSELRTRQESRVAPQSARTRAIRKSHKNCVDPLTYYFDKLPSRSSHIHGSRFGPLSDQAIVQPRLSIHVENTDPPTHRNTTTDSVEPYPNWSVWNSTL